MPAIKVLLFGAAVLFSAPAVAQRVAVVKFPELQKRLSRPNDTTYVVNFWATWCAPCVKELPNFERLGAAYAARKVKVLLVSMDYASQVDKKVRPFVAKQKLKSEVLLLNESDPNTWLEKVDAKWSGALPFTLIMNNKTKQRAAYEQELTQAQLSAALKKFL
jgi:thiol-disulfide isomerase/thioredoxin